MVEATGLEPTTFWSLTRRATKLRYASINYPQLPTDSIFIILKLIKKSTVFSGFDKNFGIVLLFIILLARCEYDIIILCCGE